MNESELKDLINKVQNNQWEEQTLEIKSARQGAPHLYDTLSSFSNQNEGGTILCGINEKNHCQIEGVYDGKSLQDKIGEQCEEMNPIVRPKITLTNMDGETVLAAEIPGLPYDQRPCFHSKKGIEKGSYVRVGQFDKPMTSREIFEYDSYRKNLKPETDEVLSADLSTLNPEAYNQFISLRIERRPQVAKLPMEKIQELSGLIKNDHPTKMAMLLFGWAPQMYFPDLVIEAVVYPTNTKGNSNDHLRFIDNQSIEGTLQEMAETAVNFIKRNLRNRTYVTGAQIANEQQPEIPEVVLREVIINALIHRDYSEMAESLPIRIEIYPNRIVITNPGALYGNMSVDSLGDDLFPPRNPYLVKSFELLNQTENRGSGIPTIRNEMKKIGLPEPKFISRNARFTVILDRPTNDIIPIEVAQTVNENEKRDQKHEPTLENILTYCQTPRSRQELVQYFGFKGTTNFVNKYMKPLIEEGKIRLTIPDNFSSRKQRFFSVQDQKSSI